MGMFGKDKFFEIKDPERLLKSLTKRKYWSNIRPELLQRVAENAKGSPITLTDFVMISEQYDLVRDQFTFASKTMQRSDDALASISFTLFSLADGLIKQFENSPPDSPAAQLWPLIAVALEASILCDPFQLFAYGSLGWFLFHAKLPEKALSVCSRYDQAERRLLETLDDSLNDRHLVSKRSVAEPRALIASLREKLAPTSG